MGIYINQSFKLSLETGIDLTAYTSIAIKYRKPDGVEGSWTPSVTAPATNGTINYEIPVDVLDVEGTWSVWSFIVNTSGTFPGNPVQLEVEAEGENPVNKDFIKSFLGITVDTYDYRIDAMIPVLVQQYLNIRNAPWDKDEEGNVIYPLGIGAVIAQMYEYNNTNKLGAITAERIGNYSVSYANGFAQGYPIGITSQIKSWVRGY